MTKKQNKKSGGSVKGVAADTWEKLEQVFESRVVRVLHAMQIPSHDDVQQLASRVEALTQAVEKLAGEPVVTPTPKRSSKSAKKATKKSRKKTQKKSGTRQRKSSAKKTAKKKRASSKAARSGASKKRG